MESVKKWLTERTAKKNGIYVHYTPPKAVGVVSGAQLRQLARGGPDSKLERMVLGGQGRRLLEEAEALPLAHHLPALVAKCAALHAAVERGSLMKLQELLEPDYNRRKFVMCLDEAGVGLLHKAIYYDFMDIAQYLVQDYPQLVHMKDSEGRTPLHYAAVCRSEARAAALLEGAGAARGARDAAGHTPAHYRGPARLLLALPTVDMAKNNPTGLVIKRHNIRIWCHDCDMARLQRVVWEGHGARLLSEVSSQPVVKKFLEAVPYIMNTIKDIHTAVVGNDLEGVMRYSGDPVPPQALSSRDAHNMTVMHKAAGLGHVSIMKYVAERYPQGVNDIDNDGRTPLHYAAAMRDDQHTYNTLVGLGADESIVDNKNKTAAFYVNRPQDIDKSLFKTIPDAPRTPSSAYPSSWDWKLLDTEVIAELNKKSRRRHLRASNENISSKNNTNTLSETTDNHIGAMKASSTHELIKDLPELEENKAGIGPNDEEESKENNEPSKDDEEDTSQNEETDLKTNEETGENETEENAEESNEDHLEVSSQADEEQNETCEDKETVEEVPNELNSDETKTDDKENNIEHEAESPEDHEPETREEDEAETHEEHEAEPHEELDADEHQTADIDEHNEKEDINNKDNEDKEESANDMNDSEEPNENSPEEEDASNNDDKETNHQSDDEQEANHEVTYINDGNKVDGRHSAKHEGNNNSSDNSEDDDDVQVQGDTQSEYSDANLKSTAEASSLGSAHLGSVGNGRNSQESLIEGIVNGEAEQDSQDASITQFNESIQGEVLILDNEVDNEVTDLINTANMEMLAALVLNGEGSRLVGRRSGNSELQGFLDNVESYMQKINMVHQAAKEGNIPIMQSALDRRKFAIARDPISPNGATPMHVATVFGKTTVMKYLGSKFPETLSAVDFEGRTALHYAAVLPDNGHYYNLLQQLGANSKDLDDNGRSAEDYRKNQSFLTFDQLLTDFGISDEDAQAMFVDKGPAEHDTGRMDIPIFRTEEGRYLAQSLGDPLIKGLTEVANVKPKDPVAFLASFLHNFPENEKPQIGTQESNVLITGEAEVENEQAPPVVAARLPRSATRTATRPHKPIDVVALDPQPLPSPDGPEIAFSSAKRDEHGQSMLHFAAARTHSRNALFQLLQESDVSIGYRDELYRTARDVSTQANVPDNTTEIDRFVLHLAARGNAEKIAELLAEGYDHILDVTDENGATISDVIAERGDAEMIKTLASIPAFEEKRDMLHSAVRQGNLSALQAAVGSEGGRKLVCAQNSFSRTALHIAVLAQHEEVVAYLAQNVPELLRIGDNLERTPLHYAMGVEKIESLSRVLNRAGAKRVLKDLKGRQPSYYFMNKSEILRLQEEEEIY